MDDAVGGIMQTWQLVKDVIIMQRPRGACAGPPICVVGLILTVYSNAVQPNADS